MKIVEYAILSQRPRLDHSRTRAPGVRHSWRPRTRRLTNLLLLFACLLAVIGYEWGALPVHAQSTPSQVLNYLYIPTQSVSGLNVTASIAVVDAVSLRTETIIPVGVNRVSIWHVAVAPNGERVYVTYSGGIAVVDTATNTIQATLPYPNRREILISQDSRTAYLRNGARIEVLDLATNTITATIDLGGAPAYSYNLRTMAFSLDGRLLYASAGELNQVATLDLATNSVLNRLPVTAVVRGLAVAPGNRLYTLGADNLVTGIDLTTGSVVATIPVSGTPAFIAMTLDGARVYVADALASVLSIINPATNSVTNTIPLYGRPTGIETGPDGRIFVLTYDGDSGYVAIFHPSSTTPTIAGTPRFPTSIGFLTVAADRMTVNSTADPGTGGCNQRECTLREALALASRAPSAVTPTVAFNIPGDGPHTIQLTSNLPTIDRPIVIDGFTQPGAQPNTNPMSEPINAVLKIELRGGFIDFNTFNATLRGLVLNRGMGVTFYRGGGLVQGCFIGTDVTGTQALGTAWGIRTGFTGGVQIGGGDAAARNLLAGNSVAVEATYGIVSVQGNFIGTDVTGTSALPNGTAIQFGSFPQGEQRRLSVSNNLIAGNQQALSLGDGFVSVSNNLIGTDRTGTQPLPNGGTAIIVNTYGHQITNNVIAYNLGNGIVVNRGSFFLGTSVIRNNRIFANHGAGIVVAGGYVEVTQNRIYDNGALGIDLANNGVTPNDPLDSDSGPNDLQNFPTLNLVANDAAGTVVNGLLAGAPNRTFKMAFFANLACDASGYGEGDTFLQEQTVTTDSAGKARFALTLANPLPPGHQLSATATGTTVSPTDGSALPITSEFGPCRAVTTLVNQALVSTIQSTAYSSVAEPNAPAGVYTIVANFTNQSAAPLTDLAFKVITLSNGNLLLNADGEAGGVGAVLNVPGRLAPGGQVNVTFRIGLQVRAGFQFFVNAYGVDPTSNGAAVTADNGVGFDYSSSTDELQAAPEPSSHQYLPLITQ